MSVEALLIDEYNSSLMANADVRALMSSVAQDPQNESVDMKESMTSVRGAVKDPQMARRQIIGWLNKVYFSMSSLGVRWWWEMNTRLSKLLIVAMVLEGDNLRSFGATPESMDIPQCLVTIKTELEKQRTQFPLLAKAYKETVDSVDPAFLALYLNK